MKKTILGVLISLMMISSVSAIYCDDDQFREWYGNQDSRADLNEDGLFNLIDVTLYAQTCVDYPVEVEPQNGDDTNYRSLTEMSRVRFLDTQGKRVMSGHKFYIEREEYAIDLVWQREWYHRWFASPRATMYVYGEDMDLLFTRSVRDGPGSFSLDGNTVYYSIKEGNNIALKRITLSLGE